MTRLFLSSCGEKLVARLDDAGLLKILPQDTNHAIRKCDHCRAKRNFIKSLIRRGK